MSLTYDEITRQYDAMTRTMEYVDARLPELAAFLNRSGQHVFIGCGSSFAMATSGALAARLILDASALAIPAGDLLIHADTYRQVLKGCTLVALSRSGETSEIIRAVERVREMDVGCKVLGVICTEGSTLAAHCDYTLEMPWAFDHSVCQTRTVSCLYLLCTYIAARLSGNERLVADLRAAVADGPAYMRDNEPVFETVACGDWTHAVVLGDAELSGLCEEGALAFKEICQIPSNHYHLLDVRHGPMVLVGEKTLVIAVLSAAKNKLELDVLSDIAVKGATVVAYSDEPLEMPGVVSVSFGQRLLHPARGIPAIAICQLISYYKSFQTGANPDQPDGLNPWIQLA